MARDLVWAAVAVSIAIGSLTLAFWPASKDNVVVVKYDCRVLIGGWHPDIPLKVQDECRKRSDK